MSRLQSPLYSRTPAGENSQLTISTGRTPGRESSEEEPNWKNLRGDIESKDRDFRARRTFVSTGKNIFPSPNVDLPRSDAERRHGAHVPCNSYSASRGNKRKETRRLSLSLVSTPFPLPHVLGEKSKSNFVRTQDFF